MENSNQREAQLRVLYDPESRKIMRIGEAAFQRGVTRLQEIKNFARQAGYKRLGIANCISFNKEALSVKQFLSDEFEVFTIDCKIGRYSREEMLGYNGGIMCNPAGQADFLKNNKTELNISMGLCVAHEMIFNQKSSVQVAGLAIKDHANRKNPMESISQLSE